MAVKKKKKRKEKGTDNKDCAHFLDVFLLCFCIVFVEHLRSLNGKRGPRQSGGAPETRLVTASGRRGPEWVRTVNDWDWSAQGGWKICMISLFLTHKVFRAADGCFSTLGMTNICQLLSIRSAAPSLASLAPFMSLRDYRRGSAVNCPNH